MKRIYIAIAFLLISLLIGAVELGFVSAKVDVFNSRVSSCDRLMRQYKYSDAKGLCENIEKKWKDDAKIIDVALNHDNVDSITKCFARMTTYVENHNIDMYFSESAAVKKELASIKDSEFTTLENIL